MILLVFEFTVVMYASEWSVLFDQIIDLERMYNNDHVVMIEQTVTVEAIHHTVQILPTKTKPKKLVFMGSNGKK